MTIYTQLCHFLRLDKDPEMQRILVVMLVFWAFWKPLCSAINRWRMHRRLKKYPQLVICRRVVEKVTNGGGKQRQVMTRWVVASLGSLVLAPVAFLVVAPLRAMQLLLAAAQTVMFSSRKEKGPKNNLTNNVNQSPTRSPQAPQHRGCTPAPPSVLRKTLGRPSSNTTSFIQNNARVEFAEHSNGSVRTERCYYNPSMQPSRSIQKPKRLPEMSPPFASDSRSPATVSHHQHHSPAKSSPPRSAPSRPLSHVRPLRGDFYEIGRVNTPRRPNDFSQRSQNYSPQETFRVSDYPCVNSAPSRPIIILQTPLSEQMKKRRFEEGGESNTGSSVASKRPSLGGRVALGGTRPRIISTLRGVQNKREREKRGDRVFKDLNTKRIKNKPVDEELTAYSTKKGSDTTTPGVSASEPAQTTAFQFGNVNVPASSVSGDPITAKSYLANAPQPETFGTSETVPLPADQSSSLNGYGATKPPEVSFGAAPSTEPNKEASAGAPLFAFDGAGAPTPAPAAPAHTATASGGFTFGGSSGVSQKNDTNIAAAAAAPPPPSFAFGSAAPTPAAVVPAPTGNAGGGFSLGHSSSASQNNDTNTAAPPQFAFGGSAPTPNPATGFSFDGGHLPTPVGPALASAPSFSFGNPSVPEPAIGTVPQRPTFGGAPVAAAGGFAIGAVSGGSARRRAQARTGRRAR